MKVLHDSTKAQGSQIYEKYIYHTGILGLNPIMHIVIMCKIVFRPDDLKEVNNDLKLMKVMMISA